MQFRILLILQAHWTYFKYLTVIFGRYIEHFYHPRKMLLDHADVVQGQQTRVHRPNTTQCIFLYSLLSKSGFCIFKCLAEKKNILWHEGYMKFKF